jgi:hypothetical protein
VIVIEGVTFSISFPIGVNSSVSEAIGIGETVYVSLFSALKYSVEEFLHPEMPIKIRMNNKYLFFTLSPILPPPSNIFVC